MVTFEQTILYVDELNKDSSMALVRNSNKIFYNLNKISTELTDKLTTVLQDSEGGTIHTVAGKYICTITMSLDHHTKGMLFAELKGHEKEAFKISNKFNATVSKRYMDCFYFIKNNKDAWNDFRLLNADLPE